MDLQISYPWLWFVQNEWSINFSMCKAFQKSLFSWSRCRWDYYSWSHQRFRWKCLSFLYLCSGLVMIFSIILVVTWSYWCYSKSSMSPEWDEGRKKDSKCNILWKCEQVHQWQYRLYISNKSDDYRWRYHNSINQDLFRSGMRRHV